MNNKTLIEVLKEDISYLLEKCPKSLERTHIIVLIEDVILKLKDGSNYKDYKIKHE